MFKRCVRVRVRVHVCMCGFFVQAHMHVALFLFCLRFCATILYVWVFCASTYARSAKSEKKKTQRKIRS